MQEKRRTKRMNLDSSILLKRVDIDANFRPIEIDIINMSKVGIGFETTKVLELGCIYEGELVIWTKEKMHTFLEIVRIEQKDDIFEYGAYFIGMPDLDVQRISIYEAFNSEKQ